MLLAFYRFMTTYGASFIRIHLLLRVKKGKEDPLRLQERYGESSYRRPQGRVIWIHAASIGESMSTLGLIHKLLKRPKAPHILLTTGTVSSAHLMTKLLPKPVIHQYVPGDVPKWVQRFLEHWQPDLILWLESELWPNMIYEISKRSIPLFLLNGRISDKAYRRWLRFKSLIATLLKAFKICFVQSQEDKFRFTQLGACEVKSLGNLKFSAKPLKVDTKELRYLTTLIGKRPVWVAASTHKGEEELVAQAQKIVSQTHPEALCILIPRHPERSEEIVEKLKDYTLARRSIEQPVTPQTQIYLVDTLGELGLFYTLAPCAFIGGSLVPIGGHNLIEPMQLKCVPIHGHFMAKTKDIARILKEGHASLQVSDALSLAQAVSNILISPSLYQSMIASAQSILTSQTQVIEVILKDILPWLDDET